MSDANADVLAGFKSRWDSSAFAAATPGGFWTGRIPAEDSAGIRRVMPYLHLKSDRAKNPDYFTVSGTGDTYVDYRRVTVRVFGIGEAAVGTLVERAKGLYDRKKFLVPNAILIACLAQGETTLEPDEKTKGGEDVWIGTVEFEVTTSRAVAS